MSFHSLPPSALHALTTLVFDLDGVVWRGETAIAGAAQSLERLRAAHRKCVFATNNSSRPPAFFAQKLANIGIPASPEEVVTSSSATAYYIAKNFPRGVRVFIVGEEGIARALTEIGAQVFTSQNPPSAVPDVVVAGIDRSFTYEKLKLAQSYILSGAKFIATNRDATFPIENGVVPGTGSIVAAIETASGTVPLSMGKPQPTMLQIILEREGAAPHQAAMIGDRLDTDIACGNRAGILSVLVLTGVNSRLDAQNASAEERPGAVFADLPALTDAILGAS